MAAEPVFVAIDFTADVLRVLIAEQDGEQVLQREEWPLPELADEDAWSWEVGGRIATLFAQDGARRSAIGIGIAAPGTIDAISGTLVRSSGQPQWDGLAVVESLHRHIDAPIVAESRTVAALSGERWQGAAGGASDVLYVSLRGEPSAAVFAGGRPVRGAHGFAGALPAAPELRDIADAADAIETVVGVIADAAALLDPEVVVLDAPDDELARLVPLVQRVVDEIAPGPQVVPAALGERGALVGALLLAETVAYEGGLGQ